MVNLQEFMSLWDADWRSTDIARHFGVTRRAVRYIAETQKLRPRFGFWEKNDAALRQMWPNQPASEIAATLGTTRNAVIGRARRLDLEHKQRSKGSSTPRPWKPPSTPRPRKSSVFKERKTILLPPPPAADTDDNSQPVSFQELEANHCRYMIGGKYCGRPMVLQSYCYRHAKICYRPPPGRSQPFSR
jgi:hypothetical protein